MGILVDNFEPKHIMGFFEDICSIPHGSGKEEKLRQYIISIAKKEGYYWEVDDYGNLIIIVEATLGYDNAPSILFQSHLDMVEVKTEESNHDFTKHPIELIVEGDIVHANGTSLGADNAVGIVNMLALMVDKTVEHPKLELLFTVEEETGLVGIRKVDLSKIKSHQMINMDTGDHETMCVSCAGTTNCSISLPIKLIPMINEAYHINVNGLTGGHAGISIGLGRASAIKLMARMLNRIRNNFDINIISITRSMHHSIATETDCVISVQKDDVREINGLVNEMKIEFTNEFSDTDPNLSIRFYKEQNQDFDMMDKQSTNHVIDLIYLLPFGTSKRSYMEYDTVLCSNNIDGVETLKHEFVLYSQIRSSVDNYKAELFRTIQVIANLCNANITITDEFTGWPYNGDNDLQTTCKRVYRNMFGKEIKIEKSNGCAEPAIIVGAIPDMQVIGICPYSSGAHTVKEYMDATTFLPFWNFLKALLRELKTN